MDGVRPSAAGLQVPDLSLAFNGSRQGVLEVGELTVDGPRPVTSIEFELLADRTGQLRLRDRGKRAQRVRDLTVIELGAGAGHSQLQEPRAPRQQAAWLTSIVLLLAVLEEEFRAAVEVGEVD